MDNENQLELQQSKEREQIAAILNHHRTYLHTLPPVERKIAMLAAQAVPVWEIAQTTQLSEGAVWKTIDSVLAAVRGRAVEASETGGMGADTDPGVTGGYEPEDPSPLVPELEDDAEG
jgi:DNA-directed RNA polymerase specialized sigma24 family protein